MAGFHILQTDPLQPVWPEYFHSDTDVKTALGRVFCDWPLLLLLLPVQWERVDFVARQNWVLFVIPVYFVCYSSLFLLLDAVTFLFFFLPSFLPSFLFLPIYLSIYLSIYLLFIMEFTEGDIGSQDHTGSKCTTQQNITCTLHCAPISPSKISFHPHLSPLCSPPPTSTLLSFWLSPYCQFFLISTLIREKHYNKGLEFKSRTLVTMW